MTDAFYIPDGDRFVSTKWTRGPWSEAAQHAGPPSALLARAVEALDPPGMQLARITIEIVRPIPVAPLRIRTEVPRPGKRVMLAHAVMTDDDGVEVARASAWRIRRTPDPITDEIALTDERPPRGPDGIETFGFDVADERYLSAVEMRFASSGFFEPGPAQCWMRMRVPLVAGEAPSQVARVLTIADSGNGVSAVLPFGSYLFINTELTVHLARDPVGEWVCLDAVTRVDPHGVGLAESTLWDTRGRIGGGRQSLLIDRV